MMLLSGPNINNTVSYTKWTCPTSPLNFQNLTLNASNVETMNAVVLTYAFEFDDTDNNVDFIPPTQSGTIIIIKFSIYFSAS